MNNIMFQEFLSIAQHLNMLNIKPVLMGSLGLEYVTNEDWSPSDIDIHVPGDPRGWDAPEELRIYDWENIYVAMNQLGYQLIDLHEHEFKKNNISVEFGTINTLPIFAGVNPNDLMIVKSDGVNFKVPTIKQFLSIYTASSKDSYRNDKNNNKDFAKIDYLIRQLENK